MPAAGSGQLRTLAVRISEDLRAQLDIIAQLTGRSATEEIRLALEHWIEKTKADPEILKKAQQVQKEIERKAQTQRGAIAAIFGGEATPTPEGEGKTTNEEDAPASPRPGTRRSKPVGE
jgi:predicted DNA-binding protein